MATLLSDEDLIYAGGAQASVSQAAVGRKQLILAMFKLFEVFIHFFMADQITGEVPEFHKSIWKMMTSLVHKRIAIAVPRGHAKTTLAKLSVIWYFLFTDIRFIVYLCNTADLSEKATADIIDFMQCSNFVRLFGIIQFETEKWGNGEFIFILNTPFHGQKKCILKARGAGQRIRGLNINNMRPQVAIVDDFEDPEDLEDPKLVARNKKWFFGTFLKALDRKVAKVIYIGNLVDNNCLLVNFTASPHWESMVLGCLLDNGEPLWPDMWSVPEIIADYEQYVEQGLSTLWFAEMMNQIVAGADALIQANQIYYKPLPDPEKIRGGFVTIDPGTGTGHDDTALACHLLVEDDWGNLVPQVVEAWGDNRMDEMATVIAAIDMCMRWQVNLIGIESIAYQRALATLFELHMAMNLIRGITVVKTYPGNASKLMRIRSWAAMIIQKAYALTDGDIVITTSLLGFDVKKTNNRDDVIDACAQGQEMMKNYLPQILAGRVRQLIPAKVTRAAELC